VPKKKKKKSKKTEQVSPEKMVWMTNKPMERCPMSLVTREIQIKTTKKY
jgi:hypothetical protein